MIVMRAMIDLEDRHAIFEMMPTDQSGTLELRKHAIDGCKPDVFTRVQQLFIDLFSRHVARRIALEDLKDLEPRHRDFESGFAQILTFHDAPRCGRAAQHDTV
jgi:hypothetical protein